MRTLRYTKPVAYCILASTGILLLFFVGVIIINGLGAGAFRVLAESGLRLAFALVTLETLRRYHAERGYAFAFTGGNLVKGIIASSAMLMCILLMALKFLIANDINTAYVPYIPIDIAQQVTTGLFEEALWRGLFMAAMLERWRNGAKGRLAAALMSGGSFGVTHLLNIALYGYSFSVLYNAMMAGVIGFAIAAVYVYSGSLTACMAIHALWDITVHLAKSLIVSVSEDALNHFFNNVQGLIFFVIMPVFAVYLCVRGGRQVRE